MCRLISFCVLIRLINTAFKYGSIIYFFYISLPHIISSFSNIYSGRVNPKKCFCLLDRLWRIICWLGETMRDGFDRCLNYYKEMVLDLFSAIMSLKMQAQCPNLVFNTRPMKIYIYRSIIFRNLAWLFITFAIFKHQVPYHNTYWNTWIILSSYDKRVFKAFLSF